MKIKAVITLIAGGKDFAPGALLDVSDDEATRLIGRNFAAAVEQEKHKKSDKKNDVP